MKTTTSKSAVKKPAKKAPAKKATKQDDKSLLREFFVDGLKDIYWAEKRLLKVLPKMAKASTTGELRAAFMDHLEVTEGHVTRLEKVFELIGEKAQAKKCEAMEGLVKEGESIIEETEKGTLTRDIALIMAAQKVEHYEIATYGGLSQIAKTLGETEASDLLAQTLTEEKDTDHHLTDLAENHINEDALEESEMEMAE